MPTKRSYLFITWEGGGNVPPVLGLAACMVKRGHRVRILAEPCLQSAINNIGAEFIAFKQHFTRTDRSIDIIKDWNPRPLSIPSIDNILVHPALDVAKETQAALNQEQTDVVVADFMMIGSLIAAEAMGIKRVALFHMPEYLPGPGRPPGGMGLLPSSSFFGGLRDRLLTMIFDRVINQYLPPVNTVRQAFKLPPYTTLTDIYHQADLRLIQTSKAFDAPITPAPANVRYAGPVLDDPGWAEDDYELWPESDTRPLVVVSLSSTFQNQYDLLKNIIAAVADLSIRCLVTLGPAMEKESFETPENTITLPAIPHSLVFPKATAVLTHAGHGTVMRALAHGLPLVCMPMGRDQLDNAALVAHHGAGLKLSAKSKPAAIRKAINQILDNPAFAKNAQSLQQSILADAEQDLAIGYLEEL